MNNALPRHIDFQIASRALIAVLFVGAVVRADETAPKPINHWRFNQSSVIADRVKDHAGKLDATVTGPLVLSDDVLGGAIALDGEQQTIALAATPQPPAIPKRDLTAEAWVNVAEAREWGGIVSALQDNGDFERGWLLGFRQSNFCFALCAGESAKLTYMNADVAFQPGSWHHVVATFDGSEMRLYVDGRLAAHSKDQTGDIRYPPKFVYELAAYHDDDEHYRWPGMLHEVAVFDRALDEKQIAARFAAKHRDFIAPLRISVGPYARHVDHTTVEIKWQTDVAVPTLLEYRAGTAAPHRIGRDQPTKSHTARIADVQSEGQYTYRVLVPADGKNAAEGTVATGRTYSFDAAFDYTQDAPPSEPSPFADDAATPRIVEYAELATMHAATKQGICLVLGSARGRLAYEIARRSQFQVIVVEPDEAAASEARRLLSDAGYYGQRVSVHSGSLDDLPYADYFANVIVSAAALDDESQAHRATAWLRMLRPAGGVMLLGTGGEAQERAARTDKLHTSLSAASIGKLSQLPGEQAAWLLLHRDELPGAGDWSHQYGLADNASCSRDELVSGEMRPLWFGQPGARPMPDRGGRNPAPLAAGGNLYVEGDRILFGMDAYNGTIRWVYQIPDLRRSNVPRDSSNLAAGKNVVHVALGSSCLTIDAITGEVRSTFAVPTPETVDVAADGAAADVVSEANDTGQHEWGYLARVGDAVLGTAVHARARYVADRGEWYDGAPGWETEKVVGENVFSLDARSGEKRWEYRGGRVLNATITVGDGRVYFVESRSQRAKDKKSGRLGDEALDDTYLVALDLETGRPLWQSPVDFGTGRRVLYLSHQDGMVVAAGSSDDYRLAAFDATTGETRWRQSFPWDHDHHGGAIQHPVIVGGMVYTEFKAFALTDGKPQPGLPPRGHGCGAQAASMHAFFYRGGFHTMFDIASRQQTEMAPARSGCWLGIIPAGGIVIAPETSSGCSCTHALQTSMAFVPVRANTPKPRSEAPPSKK